jgi:hypothetical protein
MRTLQFTLSALTLLALGCRTNPNQVLLEQESRLLEDRIYQLEAQLDDSCAAREATIRENEALKKELVSGDRGPGRDASGSSSGPSMGPPSDIPRRSGRGAAPNLEAPTIELPEPSDTPPEELPGTPGSPPSGAPSVGPAGDSSAAGGVPTKLVINKRLTGGLDRDGHNGDEGVLVVVEPRDAQGRLIKSAADVSIVVMDPALEGAAQRVARWDFAADEVPSHFQSTPLGAGLRFQLAWPAEPPKNRQLQLFVRYTTPDGAKINADVPIDVRSPADPPREDRETKNWSSSDSASRPKRDRTPSSRLKPSRVSVAPGNPSDESDRPAATNKSARAATDDSPRQSSRKNRPEWKPYR